ncbi:MAG: A/G-specific adenine glycosylase, partial [Bdellovibrionales bacterium]|nr:A/G-specific adenine glycosylase [Bdellovibrionales bacterium]
MKNSSRTFPDTTLLRWYRSCGESLPWRKTRDPYRIWISEIMLQQTQVNRVVPYYERFLERFPTLSKLASASWRQVLPYWRGLGYYRRGENLLRAAKILRSDFGGEIPRERVQLLSLPGIGEYTASAILSFAFGRSEPALDTNLYRIIQRYSGCLREGVSPRAQALFRSRGRSSALLNYAFMDLGRLVCLARNPRCGECPLKSSCHYRKNHSSSLPQKATKRTLRRTSSLQVIDVGVACIYENGNYLFGKRKRAKGGLWEFPGGKREKGESIRHCLKREIQEELGVEVSVRPHFLVEEFVDGEFLFRLHFC